MQQQAKSNVIFGVHPVEEAIEAGLTIEKIFLKQGNQPAAIRSIINHCSENNIPFVQVPGEKLNLMVRGATQGIVAYISPLNYVKTEDIINAAYDKGEHPLIVICENITDVRNVGAIARSAWCSGAHGMILPTKSSAIINDEAVKASAGTILRMPVSREKSLQACIDQLKLNGISIYAADMHTEDTIDKVDFNLPLALIMGSEGDGISDLLLKAADKIIKIPMIQSAESYNVSVAAGIILYEVMKQRIKV